MSGPVSFEGYTQYTFTVDRHLHVFGAEPDPRKRPRSIPSGRRQCAGCIGITRARAPGLDDDAGRDHGLPTHLEGWSRHRKRVHR